MLKKLLSLDALRPGADVVLLLFRIYVGVFLILGVWDNIASAARMQEFAGFLAAHKFSAPDLMAPLSVWAQFLCGCAFIAGLLTRWAGIVCAVNFIVALVMVDLALGVRGAFPAAMLVGFGLLMATHGPGRFALDRLLFKD